MAIVIKLVKNAAGDEDMVLEDGILQMSENGEAAAVQMKERLLLDREECVEVRDLANKGENINPLVNTIIDPVAGTNWGLIFDPSESRGAKELEIKRVIFSTPGMNSITYWSWQNINRVLNLDFKVKSDWGELEIGEEIQL